MPLQLRVERIALGFVIFIGFLSIAAAGARYGVFIYVWNDPSKTATRVTLSNLVFMDHFMRIEILFGVIAYGLPVARKFMARTMARWRPLANWSGDNASKSNCDGVVGFRISETGSNVGRENIHSSAYEMREVV